MKRSVWLSRFPTGKLFSSFSRHLYSLIYVILTLKLLPRFFWRIMTVICMCAILKFYQINKRGLINIKKCLVGRDSSYYSINVFSSIAFVDYSSVVRGKLWFIMEIKWMGKSAGDVIEKWSLGINFYLVSKFFL